MMIYKTIRLFNSTAVTVSLHHDLNSTRTDRRSRLGKVIPSWRESFRTHLTLWPLEQLKTLMDVMMNQPRAWRRRSLIQLQRLINLSKSVAYVADSELKLKTTLWIDPIKHSTAVISSLSGSGSVLDECDWWLNFLQRLCFLTLIGFIPLKLWPLLTAA